MLRKSSRRASATLREIPLSGHSRHTGRSTTRSTCSARVRGLAAATLPRLGGWTTGRAKLAPTLSPGKTWEGFFIGSLAGMFVAFIALYQDRDHYLVIWQALVLGLVVVLAAAAGDLFESMLKRDMQVKDTGHLLGGHGGVLDRVDALLFASVAAFYVVLGFHYA